MDSDAQQQPAEHIGKNPWLAVLLTKVFPGAGHIYGGARTRGVWIAILFALLFILLLSCLVVFVVSHAVKGTRISLLILAADMLVLSVAGILVYFDAYRITKRLHPEPPLAVTLVGNRKPWLAAFLSAIIPGIGQCYNRQILKGLGIFALAIGAGVLEGISTMLFIASFLVATLAVKDAFDSAEKFNGSTGRFFEQGTLIVVLVLVMLGLESMPVREVIRANFVEAFKTASGSMYPTLKFGDHFLVGKWRGFYDPPKRGDMVVFPYPKNPSKQYIKRVVGIGGDKVQYISGELYINDALVPSRVSGTTQDESVPSQDRQSFPTVYEEQNGDVVYRVQYESDRSAVNGGPWLVPQDSVFVMGDNRDRSQDSRAWGPVRVDALRGKAIKIYWSWNGAEGKVRWARIGEMLY